MNHTTESDIYKEEVTSVSTTIVSIIMASLEGFEPTTRCLEGCQETSWHALARSTACLLCDFYCALSIARCQVRLSVLTFQMAVARNDEKLRYRICQLIIDKWQFLEAHRVARFSALA